MKQSQKQKYFCHHNEETIVEFKCKTNDIHTSIANKSSSHTRTNDDCSNNIRVNNNKYFLSETSVNEIVKEEEDNQYSPDEEIKSHYFDNVNFYKCYENILFNDKSSNSRCTAKSLATISNHKKVTYTYNHKIRYRELKDFYETLNLGKKKCQRISQNQRSKIYKNRLTKKDFSVILKFKLIRKRLIFKSSKIKIRLKQMLKEFDLFL